MADLQLRLLRLKPVAIDFAPVPLGTSHQKPVPVSLLQAQVGADMQDATDYNIWVWVQQITRSQDLKTSNFATLYCNTTALSTTVAFSSLT